MFRKLTKKLGKRGVVLLYAVFAALAAKKQLLPLLVLFLLYALEYYHLDRKAAAGRRLGPMERMAECLGIGLSWWLRTSR